MFNRITGHLLLPARLFVILLCWLLILQGIIAPAVAEHPLAHNQSVADTHTVVSASMTNERAITRRAPYAGRWPAFRGPDHGVPPGASSPNPQASQFVPHTSSVNVSSIAALKVARFNHTATLLQNGELLVVGGTGSSNVPLPTAELYNPPSGLWVAADSLSTARTRHTATLLPDGTVLVAGGFTSSGAATDSVEAYAPSTAQWFPRDRMTTARAQQTATLLPSGKVLLVGGVGLNGSALASAEIYSPTIEYSPTQHLWTPTDLMKTARVGHTATLLFNGKILVVGGVDSSGNALGSAELYDPSSNTWSDTGGLSTPRADHTATALPNGKVLVVGGTNAAGPIANAELYDPTNGSWTSTNNPPATARTNHTAVLLPNGGVLVAGGAGAGGGSLASIEIYDSTSGNWSTSGRVLTTARSSHSAAMLPGGDVLIVGGANGNTAISSVEQFSRSSGQWAATGSMNTPRDGMASALLPNGGALAVGGQETGQGSLASTEIYSPTLDQWLSTSASLHHNRYGHTATLLRDGSVLVAGGYSETYGVLESAEIYSPTQNLWIDTGNMNSPRVFHTATLLQDGRVLVVGGGYSYDVVITNGELYDPGTNQWSPTSNLNISRIYPTATLLDDGRVLVVGGIDNSGNDLDSAELYDPVRDTWTLLAGKMNVARDSHTATLFPGNRVLVAGGFSSTIDLVGTGASAITSTEILDLSTGIWTITDGLHAPRSYHSSISLPNNKVLVVGGINIDGALSTSEIYDLNTGIWSSTANNLNMASASQGVALLPSNHLIVTGGSGNIPGPFTSVESFDFQSGLWSPLANMHIARTIHTATTLLDGSILVVGGYNGGVRDSTEIYDSSTETWNATGNMIVPRVDHTVTILPDGSVLAVGGYSDSIALASAEVYSPTTGLWMPTGSMHAPRAYHTATLLIDGTVLVAGGYGSTNSLMSAEIYNPHTGLWKLVSSMHASRSGHRATLLPNETVLITGGYDQDGTSEEIFDPHTEQWTQVESLGLARYDHTATLLNDGRVMVTGGRCTDPICIAANPYGNSLSATQIYDPDNQHWTQPGETGSLNIARDDHTATLLTDGTVLVVGGTSTVSYTLVPTAEVFHPSSGQWTTTDHLSGVRRHHRAILLLNGKVLVVGGNTNPGPFATTELFDPGHGFQSVWQPQISTITSSVEQGGVLTARGSGFRGVSAASGGNSQASATDYPLFQLRSLANEQTVWLSPNPAMPWSDTNFTSLPIPPLPPGYAMATIVVNGIPSMSRLVMIGPKVGTFDSGLNLATDVWDFSNTSGHSSFDQFVEDYGIPSTTKIVTDTHVLDSISASNGLSLPISLAPVGLQAVLPLSLTADLSPTGQLVPNPMAYLYEEVIVKALYDDESTRYYDGALKAGLCAGMAATVADFHRISGSGDPPLSPATYGGETTVASIPNAPAAQSFIQQYHGRQVSSEMLNWLAEQGRHEDILQYASDLESRIATMAWRQDPDIIGITQSSQDCDGVQVGHALFPQKIVQQGGLTRIYVYDPNYPPTSAGNADNHYIDIHPDYTWTYQLSPKTTWQGTALYSMPLHFFRLKPGQKLTLPMLSGHDVLMVNGGQHGAWGGQHGAWGGQHGAWGEVAGAQTGCLPNGTGFIHQITHSFRLIAFTGPRSNSPAINASRFPATLLLPAGQDMIFKSVGGTVSDMLVFGPQSVVGYLGTTTETTTDTLNIDKDFRTVSLHTTEIDPDKQISLYQMHETNPANPAESETRVYAVSNVPLSTGETITASVPPTLDAFDIINSTEMTKTISIGFSTVGNKAVDTVVYSDTIGPDQHLSYKPTDWDHLAERPIMVEPINKDGTKGPPRFLGVKVFLPIVSLDSTRSVAMRSDMLVISDSVPVIDGAHRKRPI